MKKKISLSFWAIFLGICFILFCPLASNTLFTLNASAASNETLNISNKNFYFMKTIVPGDSFKIIIHDKQKIKASTLRFKSSDKNVATVDKSGTITAQNIGKAKIYVYNKKNNRMLCTMIVRVKESIPRVLFIGDSRTVFMFHEKNVELCGDVRNGVYIYARGGAQCDYVKEVLSKVDPNSYDKVITWMGANDRGHFGGYKKYYKKILNMNKELVVCTVGPVKDALLDEIGQICFNTDLMLGFNKSLKSWANKNGVDVIDLYHYIFQKNLKIDSKDGVHYLPRPTTRIWKHILRKVKEAEEYE